MGRWCGVAWCGGNRMGSIHTLIGGPEVKLFSEAAPLIANSHMYTNRYIYIYVHANVHRQATTYR